ncbi:MAG: phage tail family protein [Defluviitaleaceae bacterium]|nr:phage tail family protein [Defluviitaleaceae bacterium]
MFNRQPFNRGRFNRRSTGRVYLEGDVNASLSLNGSMSVAHGLSGEVPIKLILKGYKGIPRYMQSKASISLTAESDNIARRRTISGNIDIVINLEMAGKFNLVAAIKSNVDMKLSAASHLNTINAFHGSGEISLASGGMLSRFKPLHGNTAISLGTDAPLGINIPFEGNKAIALTATASRLSAAQSIRSAAHIALMIFSESFNIWRYEHIHLPNLVMGVGGELVIDTDNMTITMDGQNVMRFLSRDSEFFLLNPSENELTFTSGNINDRADMRVLWRDAWL